MHNVPDSFNCVMNNNQTLDFNNLMLEVYMNVLNDLM